MHQQNSSGIIEASEQCISKMIEAVIFDLDGTLVNLPIEYDNLFRELGRIMKMEAVRPLLQTIPTVDEKTKSQVFRVWEKAELAVSKRITINEKGIKTYSTFAEKPKALVTLQGKKIVKNIIKEKGLVFDVVITREDTLNRVEQLEKAAASLNAQFRRILFVGNTTSDLAAAKRVGCQFLKIE